MLDFTSALYLGFRHPSQSLRPWARLSAGSAGRAGSAVRGRRDGPRPGGPPGVHAATLATSTLHLFWDLFPILGGDGKVAIHVDAAAYPIARWGVERAACRGVPVR